MFSTEHRRESVRKPQDSPAPIRDRRVRRTRQLLHDAFIELVLEKGYDKTTIQDILDRADVGRSTFYAHYRDKEALLTANFDEMRDQLERELADLAAAGPVDVSLPAARLFEHAYQNQRVYRALCGRQGGALVQRYLRRLIGDLLRTRLQPQLKATGADVPADVAAEFYASAALGLLVWWIDKDFRHDDAWLAALYRKLAGPERRVPN
ncbi:MAG: TetR/AcrR family transcriptional regulator C-terminal domain-containing protein [Mycobacteriaceae bacterium]|nr:TetR/AcrR family transcriptional regulator C-terminal domain-containing protein [Mycobacteriaceae bacterium]